MVGIDITEISRFTLKESFLHHILTDEEYQILQNIRTDERKREYLAGRFAAKEAIFKATSDPDYLQYSILNKENGMPYVKGHPEIQISISHDGGIAAAIVMITD